MLATFIQPHPRMKVKDSEVWVLATCSKPNPRVKDSEGWVLATCFQPNSRVRIQRYGWLLHVHCLTLE